MGLLPFSDQFLNTIPSINSETVVDAALMTCQVLQASLILLQVNTGVVSALWIQGNGDSENVKYLVQSAQRKKLENLEYKWRPVSPVRCDGPLLKPSTQQRQDAGSKLALHAASTSAVRDFQIVILAFLGCLCQHLSYCIRSVVETDFCQEAFPGLWAGTKLFMYNSFFYCPFR